MSAQDEILTNELARVDEPGEASAYSEVLSHLASDGNPVIVRRSGADLAAVISLEHLDILREALARQECERLAKEIHWDRIDKTQRPPQGWFDDTDNPFEPESDEVVPK